MTHLSKKKLEKNVKDKIEKHLISIIENTGSKTRSGLLKELLTETERMMLAKRIGIIFFLSRGISYYRISDLLGVSTSTVERFDLSIKNKKYTKSFSWLKNKKDYEFLEKFIEGLVSFAFSEKRRSFRKFVDEL